MWFADELNYRDLTESEDEENEITRALGKKDQRSLSMRRTDVQPVDYAATRQRSGGMRSIRDPHAGQLRRSSGTCPAPCIGNSTARISSEANILPSQATGGTSSSQIGHEKLPIPTPYPPLTA